MSFLYVVLADITIGTIGIWRNRDEVDKLLKRFAYANLVVLQFPARNPESQFAWAVPCECPEGCIQIAGDVEEEVNDYAKGLIKLHRCPEDYETSMFKFTIGKIREDKLSMLEKIEFMLREYGPDVQTMDKMSHEDILNALFQDKLSSSGAAGASTGASSDKA